MEEILILSNIGFSSDVRSLQLNSVSFDSTVKTLQVLSTSIGVEKVSPAKVTYQVG